MKNVLTFSFLFLAILYSTIKKISDFFNGPVRFESDGLTSNISVSFMKTMMLLSFLISSGHCLANETNSRVLVLKAITDVFLEHKVDKIDHYFSKDYIQHQPGLSNGREPFKKYLVALFKAFPDYTGEIENIVVDGDLVSIHFSWAGTHTGEFMGVKPTGKKITRRTADVLKVKDGKIAEHWGVVDQLDMLKALDLVRAR